MQYPINIYQRKLTPATSLLASLVIIGFGLICLIVSFSMITEKDAAIIDWFYAILLFCLGILCLSLPLANLSIQTNPNDIFLQMDEKGITIDQVIKVGPIAWEDITHITEFDHSAPGSYGFQRVRGIDLRLSNPSKYIRLAKERNKGIFTNLKIIMYSWLYFGKIKISENSTYVDIEDLSELIHYVYNKQKTNTDPVMRSPQSRKIF